MKLLDLSFISTEIQSHGMTSPFYPSRTLRHNSMIYCTLARSSMLRRSRMQDQSSSHRLCACSVPSPCYHHYWYPLRRTTTLAFVPSTRNKVP